MSASQSSELLESAIGCMKAGDWSGVSTACRRILEISAGDPYALQLLGVAELVSNNFADALLHFDAALAAAPDSPALLENRAIALRALERFAEAEATFERGLALAPQSGTLRINLARLRVAQERFEDAIQLFGETGALVLEQPDTAQEYARALRGRGRAADAVQILRAAAGRFPGHPNICIELGNALSEAGDPAGAVPYFREFIRANPEVAAAHVNLGTAFVGLGQLDAAAESYQNAIAIDPKLAVAIGYLGNAELMRGNAAKAVALYRQALSIAPLDANTHRHLLLAMLYDPSASSMSAYSEAIEFVARHAPPKTLPRPGRAEASGARIKIGYLTSDLYNHPVARSVGPIILAHDRRRFEIHIYSDTLVSDEVTARFKNAVDGWHELTGDTNESVAEKIRVEKIDILVCVAGRFDGNRPLVAAWKPAHVHLSLGDVATSGNPACDYIFADHTLVPKDSKESFVETIFRLPTYFLHEPIAQAPVPGPTPSDVSGVITFGCLNNPAKVTDAVLELWVRLLAETPTSRLLLKYKNHYSVASVVARIEAACRSGGIDPARVLIRGSLDATAAHLAHYDAIDVALDPFPFSGSTASFEALWMGVPVVTLPGEKMVSRWTAAMLVALGQRDWIARDRDDYIAIAQRLAADTAARTALRVGLRDRLQHSKLCDIAARTRQIERAYEWMLARANAKRDYF
jgi:protein O-GlcNAc transferase